MLLSTHQSVLHCILCLCHSYILSIYIAHFVLNNSFKFARCHWPIANVTRESAAWWEVGEIGCHAWWTLTDTQTVHKGRLLHDGSNVIFCFCPWFRFNPSVTEMIVQLTCGLRWMLRRHHWQIYGGRQVYKSLSLSTCVHAYSYWL